MEQRNISGLTPFEMSDDINLKSLIKENSGTHSTPVKALSDWLTTSSSKHQGIDLFQIIKERFMDKMDRYA